MERSTIRIRQYRCKTTKRYLTEATRVGANGGHNVAGASARAVPAEATGGVGGGGSGDSGARRVRVLGDGAGKSTVGGTSVGTGVNSGIGGTSASGLEGSLGSNVENTGSGVGHVGNHDG